MDHEQMIWVDYAGMVHHRRSPSTHLSSTMQCFITCDHLKIDSISKVQLQQFSMLRKTIENDQWEAEFLFICRLAIQLYSDILSKKEAADTIEKSTKGEFYRHILQGTTDDTVSAQHKVTRVTELLLGS